MRRGNASRFVTRMAVACVVSATWLHGAGLEYLTAHADAVVVGSVTNRMEGPRQVSFTIDVERVLSGSVPGPVVTVIHPWAGLLRRPSRVEQPLYGFWFLSRGPAGAWDVLVARPSLFRTALGLFLPASHGRPSGPYAYPAGTPLVDV